MKKVDSATYYHTSKIFILNSLYTATSESDDPQRELRREKYLCRLQHPILEVDEIRITRTPPQRVHKGHVELLPAAGREPWDDTIP